MKIKKFDVIGTMSGTSCDGLDIAYCDFWEKNKKWNFKLIKVKFIPYESSLRKKLLQSYKLTSYELKKLDIELGDFSSNEISKFMLENSIKPIIISHHGHTVFHNPQERISLQIGNPILISKKTQSKVINNFRELDVLSGGVGAPLVPYGDKKLFDDYDFCINIGGIANISKLWSKELIAFDMCPANILLNRYSRLMGYEYDRNGNIASKGKVLKNVLDNINNISFYDISSPKSLNLEYILNNYVPLLEGHSIKNILNTLVHHIAYQINKNIDIKKSNVLLSGGGVYNKYLIEKIYEYNKQQTNFVVPNSDIISFKEAIIFGYLGLLRFLGLKNIENSVTGSSNSSSSGIIFDTKLF